MHNATRVHPPFMRVPNHEILFRDRNPTQAVPPLPNGKRHPGQTFRKCNSIRCIDNEPSRTICIICPLARKSTPRNARPAAARKGTIGLYVPLSSFTRNIILTIIEIIAPKNAIIAKNCTKFKIACNSGYAVFAEPSLSETSGCGAALDCCVTGVDVPDGEAGICTIPSDGIDWGDLSKFGGVGVCMSVSVVRKQ
jgi:hypothetical protein